MLRQKSQFVPADNPPCFYLSVPIFHPTSLLYSVYNFFQLQILRLKTTEIQFSDLQFHPLVLARPSLADPYITSKLSFVSLFFYTLLGL